MLKKVKTSFQNSIKTFFSLFPMILSIVGLIGIFKLFITPKMLSEIFTGNPFLETLKGVVGGAISIGQPFLSYIIGGELLENGASFYGVTAFILSFVTLGVIQLPLEFAIFGVRFTLIKNLLSLIFAFILSFLITISLKS